MSSLYWFLSKPETEIPISYSPGTIIIFRSGDLYHGVSPWRPIGGVKENGVTPGRVAHVFFSPSASLALLEDKPRDWLRGRFMGILPDIGF